MGLGPALREEMQFEDGKILNAGFSGYKVPRFKDVPRIDVHLINKTDIPSAGGGETPIIAIAPAIANAVFAATGIRVRSMPMQSALFRQL
jgi:isoquinoline 1-oxidoreductase